MQTEQKLTLDFLFIYYTLEISKDGGDESFLWHFSSQERQKRFLGQMMQEVLQ